MNKILFINNKNQRCGIADYGRRMYSIIKDHFDITYCDDIPSYEGYDIALYNYHYATLPYINASNRSVKHIALFHEAFKNFEADEWINVSELPRPVYNTSSAFEMNNLIPRIGSFGFGFADKDFSGLCKLVRNQFEKALIYLNVPFAEFGDNYGSLSAYEAVKCDAALGGSDIRLIFSNRFLEPLDLITFLAGNDINLFLYKDTHGRGISSAIDYALSAKRPIGISSSEMFRHLPREICVDNISLPELIGKGIEPLKKVYEDNSNEKLVGALKKYLV